MMKTPSLEELAGGVAGEPKSVEVKGYETMLLVRDVAYADMEAISSEFAKLDESTSDDSGIATMAILFEKTLTDSSGKPMSIKQASNMAKNCSGGFLKAASEAIMGALNEDLDVEAAKKNSARTGRKGSGTGSRGTSKRRTRTTSNR